MKRIGMILLMLIIVTSTSAHAIRVIYGGGGYSEMVVLKAFAQMPTWLEIYQGQATRLHSLSRGEEALLRLATEQDFSTMKVEFFADSIEGDRFRYLREKPSVFFISSASLYNEDKSPREVSALFTTAFESWANSPEARLLREERGVTRAHVTSLAEKLKNDFFSRLSYQSWSLNSEFRIHKLDLILEGREPELVLLLENKHETFDWTERLRAALPCEAAPATLRELEDLRVIRDALTGRLHWLCEGDEFEGQFAAQLHEGQMSVLVHSERRVGVKSECERALRE